jgi:capsular exopolysaccharide synthesis family protein
MENYRKELERLHAKIEARKKELRPEIIERKRQAAATAIIDLKRKIALLTTNEAQFQKKARDLEAEVRVRRVSNDSDDLRREIALREEVLSRLGAELERTRVELQADLELTKEGLEPDERVSASRVRKWSKAQPARITDGKSKLTKTIATGVGSFLLPMVVVVLLEIRKARINSHDEIQRGLGLSVLGSLPLIPGAAMRNLRSTSPKQQYWRTLLAESVDSIAAVLLRGVKQNTIRKVMVSSATSGEGKTTLAANLATSLASAGHSTVLVDFDLRCPALHRVLDLNLQPGLNELLRDPKELHASLQKTQIPNLAFLAAGRWSSTGLAGLATADLKSLFKQLLVDFEFVVVDGSPILPIVDTRLIAQHVDTVIISVLRDKSRVPQVRAACELLRTFSVSILGVVMTGSFSAAYPDSKYSKYSGPKAV